MANGWEPAVGLYRGKPGELWGCADSWGRGSPEREHLGQGICGEAGGNGGATASLCAHRACGHPAGQEQWEQMGGNWGGVEVPVQGRL